MRYLTAIPLLLAFWLGYAAPSVASPLESTASTVETHELRYQVNGHTVTTYIHLFRESPYQNPKLLEQISQMGLSHVAFLDEEKGDSTRSPSGLSEFEQLQDDVGKIEGLPVVKIKQKKGFFKRLAQLWNISFHRSTLKPGPLDFKYGLVSTVTEVATSTAMVFTSPELPLESGIALVAATGTLSFVNNVWNNGINHFLSGGQKALTGAKALRYWGISTVYDFVQSQALKWIQVGGDITTWNVQSTILMNTLASGVGDTKLNNNIFAAYGSDPERLARANYYINLISTAMSSIDLMQSNLMPVLTHIGAYELRLSAPILIGYYVAANYLLTKYPQQVYRVVEFIQNSIDKVKFIAQKSARSCLSIFRPQNSGDSGPHDGMEPQSP